MTLGALEPPAGSPTAGQENALMSVTAALRHAAGTKTTFSPVQRDLKSDAAVCLSQTMSVWELVPPVVETYTWCGGAV